MRGYLASRILVQNGFTQVYNLSGGTKVYNAAIAKQSNIISHKENSKALEAPIPTLEYEERKTVEVDACGLQCPGPIMKLKDEIDKIKFGERLHISASDPGFFNDVASWCQVTGHKLINRNKENGTIKATIEKVNKAHTDFRNNFV